MGNMESKLKNNIVTAIEDMKEAKEAYLQLTEVYYDSDSSDRVYTKLFSQVMNNIHSITDTLLNVFVEEKQIKKEVIDSRTGRTREVSDPNTMQLCEMIVKHNIENVDNQYLTDVDFFVLCDKADGNEKVHNGIIKDMQDMYRLFLNYNRILLALDCNEEKETVEIESDIEKFDFQVFQAYFDLDEEEAEDRRFILVVDSLHDVNKQHLSTFLQLPWSAVIDLDGITEIGGVGSSIKNSGIERNAYSYLQAIDRNNNMSFYNKVMHINACDTSKKITRFLGGIKYNRDDNRMVDCMCEKLHDASHPFATIVIVGNVTERMKTICVNISTHFKETKILVLSEQSMVNQNIPVETSEDELDYEENVIAEVQVFNSSIHAALQCIYNNRESLPKVEKHLFSDENVYRMPKCNPIEKSKFLRFENDLELLHLGLGKDLVEQNHKAFFRGDLISWATIKNKCTLPVISESRFIEFVNDMKKSKGHKCFYIYHRPGFGGTTLGRQLIWEMHSFIPCVRIKNYQGYDWFKRILNDLYKLFENSLFWVLVDQNDINNGDIEEIEYEVEKGDYNVCALVIKCVTDTLAKERVSKKTKNEVVLRLLESETKTMLESKCMSIVDDNEVFNRRIQNLRDNLKPAEECPLIVNLYLLEDNFKLDTYVKARIETIPDDSDKEKVCRLLAFAAIGSLYSNVKFPASYFRQYLGQKNIEREKKCFEGILLRRKESDETLYFVNHYLIAKEILVQLLTVEEGISWTSRLPQYSKMLIDWLCDLMGNVDYIDDRLLDILCCLFTDKTKGSQLESKEYDVAFTQLFEAMDQPPRIDVICHLANKMTEKIVHKIPKGEGRKEYCILAHIYAQQAKIRLLSERLDENQDEHESKEEELMRYINQTTDLIDSEGIHDKVLEDILARCSLKRAKDLRNMLDDSVDAESLDKILSYVDDAIYHFKYSIWYGSCDYGVPGKIEAYTIGLSSIVISKQIPEKNRIEKLHEDEIACKYIDEAMEAIRDIEEYELTNFAIAVCQRYREKLLSVLYPEKTSDLLQRLDSIRNNTVEDDYETHYFVSNQIVYAYERKYYNPDRYRGSELIKKALEGDKDAIADADKAFENLQKIMKMNINHHVSSVTYKRWFEYAKYKDVPLETAKSVARAWRDSINYNMGREYRASAIQPYYYLFVITLLQYISSVESISSVDVYERKNDLKNILKKNLNHSHSVIDWYSSGRGLGKLYSREWIDIKDVANEERIAVVSGRVVHLDEKYVGYMRITNPAGIGKWSQAQLGYGYNTDSDVRFKEEQTTLISHSDVGTDKEWKFKFGFSYENFELSMNSLELLSGIQKPSLTKKASDSPINRSIEEKSNMVKMSSATSSDQYSRPIFMPKYVFKDPYGNSLLIIGSVNGERAAIHRKELEKQTDLSEDMESYMASLVENNKKYGIPVVVTAKTEKGLNCTINRNLSQSGNMNDEDGSEYEEFRPVRFIRNVLQGTIRNGVLASISKKNMTYEDIQKINELINTNGTMLVHVIRENPQKTGYIVEMK